MSDYITAEKNKPEDAEIFASLFSFDFHCLCPFEKEFKQHHISGKTHIRVTYQEINTVALFKKKNIYTLSYRNYKTLRTFLLLYT